MHYLSFQREKVFFMTQAAFDEIKSMIFIIIPWHSKISIAVKHWLFSGFKKFFDFHSSDGSHFCNRHSNKSLILLVVWRRPNTTSKYKDFFAESCHYLQTKRVYYITKTHFKCIFPAYFDMDLRSIILVPLCFSRPDASNNTHDDPKRTNLGAWPRSRSGPPIIVFGGTTYCHGLYHVWRTPSKWAVLPKYCKSSENLLQIVAW